MKELEARILRDGKNLGDGILKVDGFVNHQVDPRLMDSCGREFARLFSDVGATKILTAEISGISSPGAIECDLAPWDDPDTHEARVAVWDRRLNCTVSDPVVFTLQAPVNGWKDY